MWQLDLFGLDEENLGTVEMDEELLRELVGKTRMDATETILGNKNLSEANSNSEENENLDLVVFKRNLDDQSGIEISRAWAEELEKFIIEAKGSISRERIYEAINKFDLKFTYEQGYYTENSHFLYFDTPVVINDCQIKNLPSNCFFQEEVSLSNLNKFAGFGEFIQFGSQLKVENCPAFERFPGITIPGWLRIIDCANFKGFDKEAKVNLGMQLIGLPLLNEESIPFAHEKKQYTELEEFVIERCDSVRKLPLIIASQVIHVIDCADLEQIGGLDSGEVVIKNCPKLRQMPLVYRDNYDLKTDDFDGVVIEGVREVEE